MSLDQHPEKRSGKRGRLHLDLYMDDQDSEVERLAKLGARLAIRGGYEPGDDFVVLEDPNGNLFCVVQVLAYVINGLSSNLPSGHTGLARDGR